MKKRKQNQKFFSPSTIFLGSVLSLLSVDKSFTEFLKSTHIGETDSAWRRFLINADWPASPEAIELTNRKNNLIKLIKLIKMQARHYH